jgi:hypothetical protein
MPSNQNSKSVLDHLNTIGSKDRGDDVALNRSAAALIELGEYLITTARKNLNDKGHTATGETASSMRVVNINVNTMKMSLDVELVNTYKFLDQGVKGTEGGAGKYSFKTKYPSKKMATAILKWARKRSLSGKIKYKAKGAQEAKDKKINKVVSQSDNLKSLAYAISTNIKKHGIDRTLFFSNAIKETKALQKKKFAEAFKLDIIENLS